MSVVPRGPLHRRGDQRRPRPRRGLHRRVPGRDRRRRPGRAARAVPAQGAGRPAGAAVRGAAGGGARAPRRSLRCRVADLPDGPEARRCLELRARSGISCDPDAPAFVLPSGEPVRADELDALAADGAAGAHEPGGQRRHLPLAAASPPRPGGRSTRRLRDEGRTAARLPRGAEARQIDEPKIDGPLDVIVRIGAAGLCRTDLHIQEGQWAEKSGVELPYTPGHENAGWVHEIGSGVTNVEVGDTVIVHPFISCGLCRPCRRGRRHALPERLVPRDQPRRRLRRVPADLGAVGRQARPVAASRRTSPRSPTPGLTAIHAVKKAIPVLGAGTQRGRHRRRRARPHRHPVPEGEHAGRDHRRSTRPRRRWRWPARWAPTTPCRSTARTSTRSRR